jgi:hypothetical protein
VKIASFTLHATATQSARWKQAAEAEGFPSVGAWAAVALDSHLRARATSGKPLPMAWRQSIPFRVVLMNGKEVPVRGSVSEPFAIFQGTTLGPDRNKMRTLVYLPTRRVIATMKSSRECKELASELARFWVRWEGSEDSTPTLPA